MGQPATDRIGRRAADWAARRLGRETVLIPLAGDGGGRRYFRLPDAGLALLYGPDKAENLAWLRIGRHLWFKGLTLPRIIDWNLVDGFFLLEDLGDRHLVDPRSPNPSNDEAAFYPAAAELLARLHNEGLEGFDTGWCFQTRSYDAAMIEKQEIGYFLDSMVLKYLQWPKLPPGIRREARLLSRRAAPVPEARVLMHRDFQGRNLLVKNGRVFTIDWQGARPGSAAYDLASLLEECPHKPLSEAFKEDLIRRYLASRGKSFRQKDFRRELAVVGTARLMQALGAYAKLTLAGKPKFAAYMVPTINSLWRRLADPALKDFPVLSRIVAEAAAQLEDIAGREPGSEIK